MKRAIVAFQKDEHGDWVALLACGHTQHVRHHPPWQNRPWVESQTGRNSRIGVELNCKKCDTQKTADENCRAKM
jgi:cytochrome c-type biogenesis protein CcmH/NrfF